MSHCQRYQQPLGSYLVLALAALALVDLSDGMGHLRFYDYSYDMVAPCRSLLNYEGMCSHYHLEVTHSCKCLTDYTGENATVPNECLLHVCDKSKPRCVSDTVDPLSACTDCEHVVTGRNQSCVKYGSCHQIIGDAFCCHTGFRAEDNECVDVNECVEYSNICPDICRNHQGTYECKCSEGSTEVDGYCLPVDPCLKLNCSHTCKPKGLDAECACPRGYELVNVTECKLEKRVCPSGYHLDVVTHSCLVLGAKPQLVFVQNRVHTAHGLQLHENDSVVDLADLPGDVTAVTYDSTQHVAYFVGDNLTSIDYSGKKTKQVMAPLNYTGRSVAYDWRADLIYVLNDDALELWNVSEGKLRFETALVRHNGRIRDIVVDPLGSWLFWASEGIVSRATLQGRQPLKLFSVYQHVEDDVHSERLALDNSDLYDVFVYYAVNTNLFSFNSAGSQMTWHTGSLPGYVRSMDIFEDWVYMVIHGQDGVYARRKLEPTVTATYLNGQSLDALYVNHPLRSMDYKWKCSLACEQLCFRLPNLHSICDCRTGFTLAQNRLNCNVVLPRRRTRTHGISAKNTSTTGFHRKDEDTVLTASSVGAHQPYRMESSTTESSSPVLSIVAGLGLVILLVVCVGQVYILWIFSPRRDYSPDLGLAARFAPRRDSVSIMQLAENGKTSIQD
ncbi:pro-epidermal growth factor-like [Tropilaelaps mercedesae]|uniref:Pro-epidermal growth factor-like n=1 Tax=Tropilaelaps mercedesae TaxID=418985 RepID=A0A1V9X3H6_9ACAR|nr:pro-epidermal growth factor-like [Tropilaelaps mercedesae]